MIAITLFIPGCAYRPTLEWWTWIHTIRTPPRWITVVTVTILLTNVGLSCCPSVVAPPIEAIYQIPLLKSSTLQLSMTRKAHVRLNLMVCTYSPTPSAHAITWIPSLSRFSSPNSYRLPFPYYFSAGHTLPHRATHFGRLYSLLLSNVHRRGLHIYCIDQKSYSIQITSTWLGAHCTTNFTGFCVNAMKSRDGLNINHDWDQKKKKISLEWWNYGSCSILRHISVSPFFVGFLYTKCTRASDVMVRSLQCIFTLRQNSAREHP
jgi:hypothetical protein